MLNLEQVRQALSDRQTKVVAERIGICAETIRRLKRGDTVSYPTLKVLSDYLTAPIKG